MDLAIVWSWLCEIHVECVVGFIPVQVMMPNTAEKLKAQRKNQLKDFVSVAPFLGVSHMLVFSQKHNALTMRVARVPRGPTLTFNVLGYSLMRDIAARQKRPHSPGTEFQHGPLVVLNSFSSGADHVQIMSSMFQNMFEPIGALGGESPALLRTI